MKRSGQVASKRNASIRDVQILRTSGGLKKVLSVHQQNGQLHGACPENPGIIECYRIVFQMEKCRAGGLPPPSVLPDADYYKKPASTEPDTNAEYDAVAQAKKAAVSGRGKTMATDDAGKLDETVNADLRNAFS